MRHPLAESVAAPAPRSARTGPAALVAALTVLAALVVAAPAAGHDALVGSDPADGAVLTAAPAQVVLTFAAPQAGLGSEVIVTDAAGQVWSEGAAQVVDATVTQPLAPALPSGAYTVTWRSVAGDGHPVTGTLGFTVALPSPTPSAAPTPDPAAQTTAEPASTDAADTEPANSEPAETDPTAVASAPWRWLALLAGVVLTTGLVLVLRRRPSGD